MSLYALPAGLRRKLLHIARAAVLMLAERVKLTDVVPTYHRAMRPRRGSALLSYRAVTTEPVVLTTATAECHRIIELMNETGLDVTLLSCSDTIHTGVDDYDVVFGFGDPFRAAAASAKGPRILYCTEGPPVLARLREEAAFERVQQTLGRRIRGIRRHSKLYLPEDVALASHLVVLGDDRARWADCSQGKPLLEIMPTGFEPVVSEEEFARPQGRRDLIWMGSAGAVNKGLDLAIALADRCGAETLHLYGLSARERGLCDALKRHYPAVRVVDHGFTPYGRAGFRGPILQAVAAVLPSASEAAPTGCLTLCRNGVPAVISGNCGLTSAHTGVFVRSSFDDLAQRLSELFSLHADDLTELKLATYRYANREFSLPNYERALRAIWTSLGLGG